MIHKKPTLKKCDSCQKLSVIWKNDGGKRYCQRCWSAHSASTTPKPTARQKPIPPRSPKRSKQESQYGKLRKEFLSKYPMCQAHLPNTCTQIATDVHHMKGRIGNLLLNQTYWLALCRGCHNWIENHPEAAKELGFSLSRIQKTDE